MPSSALLACFVWLLYGRRFNCHAYTNKLRGTIALVANAATNCALIARVPFDRPCLFALCHRQVAATDKAKPSVRIFCFHLRASFVHIFFFSTPFLRSYLISTPPSFVPRIVIESVHRRVVYFRHRHHCLHCERFGIVPVPVHIFFLTPPLSFPRHILCCGDTTGAVLCFTPPDGARPVLSCRLICSHLVLMFSSSEVTWDVMLYITRRNSAPDPCF